MLPVQPRERIQFYRCPKNGRLAEVLNEVSEQPKTHIESLIEMGSIYLNQKRAAHSDQPVRKGDVLRAHWFPRRFVVPSFDWTSRVLVETEEFLIVAKPSGIPVHATVDNLKENLTASLSAFLQIPLYVTHRLDIGTEGVVVLAKTTRFVSDFNRMLKAGLVTKHYTVGVQNPVAPGTYTHFMEPSERAQKRLSDKPYDHWLLCQLEILSSSKHADFYELYLRLLTGRTHQIRCQLSFLGAPVLGDQMYQSPFRFKGSWQANELLALTSSRIEFNYRPGSSETESYLAEWRPTWAFAF